MELEEVRRWARERRVLAPQFRGVYSAALLHAISRLLQAMYRESRVARLWQDERSHWQLDIGRAPILRAPASGPLPFRRVEVIGMPWIITARGRRRVRTVETFLAALKRCLQRSEYATLFPALRSDFANSVANIVLNRLIGGALGAKARALEPAYQGHQYYPFPALRIGPSLSQVLDCSHLCQEPVELALLNIDSCRLVSCVFDSYEACARACYGTSIDARSSLALPIHPWQLRLSPVIRELVARNFASLSRDTIEAIPLASQRTCRVVRTGFDLKLPINATLTGEHRLLYHLNYTNAPVVSALAKQLLPANGRRIIDFQADIASLFHTEPALAPHLSVIIRAPVEPLTGEVVVPAINLWTGPEQARALLQSADAARIEEFFHRYCRALMTGPVQFCSQWGMAFEPHLQNVYVAFRDGLPRRIVLRDLDNTILNARRIQPVLRNLGLELASGTWRNMPAFESGGKRLVQAMLFGHLGEVMWSLTRYAGVASEKLAAIVEDTWSDLGAHAPSASARRSVQSLRGWSDSVKATLRTRLKRSITDRRQRRDRHDSARA